MVLKDVAAGRLDDRRDLLRRLDVLRRDIDALGGYARRSQ
jgi:hypothetical protein